MTELAGFTADADWLPASVRRAQAIEDQAERREERHAEAEREARREAAHDRALMAYRSAAEGRGEIVGAMALASGQGLGRTIGDVFADASAMADHEDGRSAARERREAGGEVWFDDPQIHGASRSDGWPQSEYELGSLIGRASDLHRWGVAYAARHGYPAAAMAARSRATDRTHAVRSGQGSHPEICRVVTDRGNAAWGQP